MRCDAFLVWLILLITQSVTHFYAWLLITQSITPNWIASQTYSNYCDFYCAIIKVQWMYCLDWSSLMASFSIWRWVMLTVCSKRNADLNLVLLHPRAAPLPCPFYSSSSTQKSSSLDISFPFTSLPLGGINEPPLTAKVAFWASHHACSTSHLYCICPPSSPLVDLRCLSTEQVVRRLVP